MLLPTIPISPVTSQTEVLLKIFRCCIPNYLGYPYLAFVIETQKSKKENKLTDNLQLMFQLACALRGTLTLYNFNSQLTQINTIWVVRGQPQLVAGSCHMEAPKKLFQSETSEQGIKTLIRQEGRGFESRCLQMYFPCHSRRFSSFTSFWKIAVTLFKICDGLYTKYKGT